MKQRYRQEVAFSTVKVCGSYRFADRFLLRPMPPGALALEAVIGQHPFLLEYRYDVPEASETPYNPQLPSHVLEPLLDEEAAAPSRKWILLTLALFSTTRIFQYSRGPLDQGWFVASPRFASTPERRLQPQAGYPMYHDNGVNVWIAEGFSKEEFDPILLIPTEQYYKIDYPQQYVVGTSPDRLQLPDRITEFFLRFDGLSPDDRLSFLSACFLFDKSIDLFWQAPSLAFAASVCSLETLIAADHRGESVEACSCCGQPKHGVRQKFLEFIKTNGSDSPELRKVADRIYQRRSKILHEGQLMPGEAEPRTIDGSIEWIADGNSRRRVIAFLRSCVINWLILHSKPGEKAL